jgi:polyhydroxyalkanoate synthesis regulator protein
MLDQPHPILVKRYAENRLFDTTHAQYVAVQDLRNWQARGVFFMVVDAKTGADVTQSILRKV